MTTVNRDKVGRADEALVDIGLKETPEERRKRKARERKKRERERNEALGVKQYPFSLALTEKEAIERGAEAAGYEDQTEYLLDLVDSDLSRMGLKRLKS